VARQGLATVTGSGEAQRADLAAAEAAARTARCASSEPVTVARS
jgi:hypothetical protein